MIRITQVPLDAGDLLAGFSENRVQAGAIVSFLGLTRQGAPEAPVQTLTLQAYPRFTEAVMVEIESEAVARFKVEDVLAVHR